MRFIKSPKSNLRSHASPKDINMTWFMHNIHVAQWIFMGFNLSHYLRTVKPETSAGRAQSPALHLIVSREKERTAFEKKNIGALLPDSIA